ncbi:SIS domain-containing protein [Ahrensia kielensis]|uniref:SIS domain-containing protein n=1 Tax=Ahrensia kielensis TaxID=76980 RepID=A0ABU9T5F4_9HYPH
MFDFKTKMRAEVEGIPDALSELLRSSRDSIMNAGAELRALEPNLICTVARGSSDHAATYLKYAIELTAQTPVASIGPSVSSIYGADLKLQKTACIGISQSGQSPDIVSMVKTARKNGSLTIGLTNTPKSPLADISDYTIDIHAGIEESVAATKTFITSVVSGLMLLAYWQKDEALLSALEKLPELAKQALETDWDQLTKRLLRQDRLYVLGRGPAFAIANEVALKFKETCQLQGEAFSSAEVLHGPVSIVSSNYPVLALVARDKAESSMIEVVDDLCARGGDVYATSSNSGKATQLPYVATGHPLTDPLLLIVSFYSFVEELSRLRGFNPDEPLNLKKVTETV